MKNLFSLFFIFSFVLGFEIYAQNQYDPIEPSANASQFTTAMSRQYGLQTGDLSLSIPLFQLKGNGYEIPITLSFNAGGIDNTTESSSIGLGWSLLAGGVITHIIRGYNDNIVTPEWHKNSNFIQNKFNEELSDSWPDNVMSAALNQVSNQDPAPDNYSYSFLGYSGDIRFEYNDQNVREAILFPDKAFQLIETSNGYKIISSDGTKYFFEEKERKSDNTMAWFISRIESLSGGVATFQYRDDYSMDLTRLPRETNRSKRITRIDFDYGYIIFNSSGRDDMYYNGGSQDARRIRSIELYSKIGTLIKGFEFYNSGTFENTYQTYSSWENKRLKLSGMREYGRNSRNLPPYYFTYDYSFYLSKANFINNGPEAASGTWADDPTLSLIVDRNTQGDPSPYVTVDRVTNGNETYNIPRVEGIQAISPNMDGNSLSDYFQLSRIDFPTGGSESYSYQKHDFSFVNTSRDTIKPPYSSNQYVSGKRLSKVIKTNEEGNTEIVEYEYSLHDKKYNRIEDGYFAGSRPYSSGILINPAIHTTTMYTTRNGLNSNNRGRLIANPYFTQKPQNQKKTYSVGYTHVVKKYKSSINGTSNGKDLYVFSGGYSELPVNYVYLNYNTLFSRDNILIGIPNYYRGKEFFGTHSELAGYNDQFYSHTAYPLGEIYHSKTGNKLLEHVTFDSNGNIVRRVKNDYEGGIETEKKSYGLRVEKFDDHDYSKNPYPQWPVSRYLISRSTFYHGISRPSKKTTVNYFDNDSVVEESLYTYNRLNLPKSTTKIDSDGEMIKQKYTYPKDIDFQTLSNLDVNASAINNMIDLNIIATPIQMDVSNGNEHIGGTFVTFQTLSNGAVELKENYKLRKEKGSTLVQPWVNTQGELKRDGNLYVDTKILSYDSYGKPSEIEKENGMQVCYIWGYDGQYPIAKIENGNLSNLSSLISNLRTLSSLDEDSQPDVLNSNGTITYQGDEGQLRASLNALRNHSSLAQANVTTYTYDPLIGITSITDPVGRVKYYEYDDFNRLVSVRDEEGNILKQNVYHYK